MRCRSYSLKGKAQGRDQSKQIKGILYPVCQINLLLMFRIIDGSKELGRQEDNFMNRYKDKSQFIEKCANGP